MKEMSIFIAILVNHHKTFSLNFNQFPKIIKNINLTYNFENIIYTFIVIYSSYSDYCQSKHQTANEKSCTS